MMYYFLEINFNPMETYRVQSHTIDNLAYLMNKKNFEADFTERFLFFQFS